MSDKPKRQGRGFGIIGASDLGGGNQNPPPKEPEPAPAEPILEHAPEMAPERTAEKAPEPPQERRHGRAVGKRTYSITLDEDLLERARNAAFWTPGLTVSALFVRGLKAELDRLQDLRGEEFPERTGEVEVGRPITTNK